MLRNDTQAAIALLQKERLTCAVCRGDTVYKSTARGVAPLLHWLDNGLCFRGFCAADKVVGAGAAYLYVLLGVTELYADVISEKALEILTRFDVSVDFGLYVARIRNRAGDGYCPIEEAVEDVTDPQDAPARIRARLATLQK